MLGTLESFMQESRVKPKYGGKEDKKMVGVQKRKIQWVIPMLVLVLVATQATGEKN